MLEKKYNMKSIARRIPPLKLPPRRFSAPYTQSAININKRNEIRANVSNEPISESLNDDE
jgi:hypothetical protein